MQQFFIDYGLWLLIALLVLIAVVFLLAGRRRSTKISTYDEPVAVEASKAAPSAPAVEQAQAPIETIAPVTPEPVAVAQPAPVTMSDAAPAPELAPAVADAGGDNLLKMKGIGPKLNQALIELGVTRYAQIAAWSDADIAAIDAKLGNFKGRPVRDQWVDQAKYLAAGDMAGFEAKYGKL